MVSFFWSNEKTGKACRETARPHCYVHNIHIERPPDTEKLDFNHALSLNTLVAVATVKCIVLLFYAGAWNRADNENKRDCRTSGYNEGKAPEAKGKTMSERFGFGIIGAGVISAWHAAGIEAHPDGRLVAVASRSRERADSFAAEHGCAVVSDWRDLVRRDDIQAVCICTPSGLHAEQAIAAASAGKHVLVEKPMAIDLKGCDEMIAAARANGVKLGVIFQKRTDEAPAG